MAVVVLARICASSRITQRCPVAELARLNVVRVSVVAFEAAIVIGLRAAWRVIQKPRVPSSSASTRPFISWKSCWSAGVTFFALKVEPLNVM